MTDTLGKNPSTTNKLSKNVSKQSWTSIDTSSDDGLSTKPVAHPPLSEKLSPSAKGLADSTQHTPGPWYNVNNAYVYARYPNKNGELIASVWCNNAGEEVGNAQLIAQAPTLKAENEALKALNAELVLALDNVANTEWSGVFASSTTELHRVVNIARDAIAKAKGVNGNG